MTLDGDIALTSFTAYNKYAQGFAISGYGADKELFEFLADYSCCEWGAILNLYEGKWIINTSYQRYHVDELYIGYGDYEVRIHSHHYSPSPSPANYESANRYNRNSIYYEGKCYPFE